MIAYGARRVALVVPTLLLASVLVFLLVRLIPGNPAYVLLGPNTTPDQVASVTHSLALDQPLPTQYAVWLGHLLRGDVGKSYINDLPATTLIGQKLPATLELAVAAMLIALLLSVPLGIVAALYHRRWPEALISVFNALILGIPVFWLGILLVLLFSFRLNLTPPSGYLPFGDDPARNLHFLILPAVTLGVTLSGVFIRFIKTSVLEVMRQDYVRTARAKGLPRRAVILRHVLKNAMIPVVTVLGLQFGGILGGVVIVESVFNWPGIGSLLVTSILSRDYAIVQAVILLAVAVYVVVNLLTDLTYSYLNPRMRDE